MSNIFIGLPVYNGEKYLAAALDCLLAQTHRDFTVLISDNASTDSTEEIGRAYAARDPRIRYHRHAQNRGAAPNFNFCVEQAEGAYFKWMAHDDLCKPTYLERCAAVLDGDPGAVSCHSLVRRIDSDGDLGEAYRRELNFNHPDPVIRFARAMALDHGCVSVFGVIRLSALVDTPRIAPFVGSDRPLLADLALRGRLEHVDEELFLWRDHPKRSVKLLDRKTRQAWFDPNGKPLWSSLFVRQLLANQAAALRVPPRALDRLRAFGSTWAWVLRSRKPLFRDFKAVLGALLRQVTPARTSSRPS